MVGKTHRIVVKVLIVVVASAAIVLACSDGHLPGTWRLSEACTETAYPSVLIPAASAVLTVFLSGAALLADNSVWSQSHPSGVPERSVPAIMRSYEERSMRLRL